MVLHVPFTFLHILQLLFVLDNLKDVCTVNQCGKTEKVLSFGAKGSFSSSPRRHSYHPLEHWVGMLTVQDDKDSAFPQSKGKAYSLPTIKYPGFPNSGSFPVMQPTVCYSCHPALFVCCPVRAGAQGTRTKFLTLWLCYCCPSSLIQESYFFFFQYPWNCGSIICELPKVSKSSQLLITGIGNYHANIMVSSLKFRETIWTVHMFKSGLFFRMCKQWFHWCMHGR